MRNKIFSLLHFTTRLLLIYVRLPIARIMTFRIINNNFSSSHECVRCSFSTPCVIIIWWCLVFCSSIYPFMAIAGFLSPNISVGSLEIDLDLILAKTKQCNYLFYYCSFCLYYIIEFEKICIVYIAYRRKKYVIMQHLWL